MSRICLNVSAHAEPRYGGIATSVPILGKAISEQGAYQTHWAAFCLDGEDTSGLAAEHFDRFPLRLGQWLTEGGLQRRLGGLIEQAAVVHIHGIWQPHCQIAARSARRLGVPYLISAHGMLEPWALRNKEFKKRIYSALFEKHNLERAACLRALTFAEAEDYRRYGVTIPIAVIPNGVVLQPKGDPDVLFERFPQLRGKQLLLFFGRLHRKKGLHVLCEAWGEIAKLHPSTQLVIAGPDEDQLQPELEQVLRARGVEKQVTFVGMQQGAARAAILAAADLFVLPSFSEGFSMATLEAMGAGVPVIVSRQCYFPEITKEGCGWIIEPETIALREALQKFLTVPPAERRIMGERGQRLVSTRYGWGEIASQFARVFDWMRGEGKRPTCVEAPERAQ